MKNVTKDTLSGGRLPDQIGELMEITLRATDFPVDQASRADGISKLEIGFAGGANNDNGLLASRSPCSR